MITSWSSLPLMVVSNDRKETPLQCTRSKGWVHTHSCNYRVETINPVSVSEHCCTYYYPVASTEAPPAIRTLPWKWTLRRTRLCEANAKYNVKQINRSCRVLRKQPMFPEVLQVHWIQLLAGGCHPEVQSVLNALHGSCQWAPHH